MTQFIIKTIKGVKTLAVILLCTIGFIAFLDLSGLLFFSLKKVPMSKQNLLSGVGQADANLGSDFDERLGTYSSPGTNLRYYDEHFYQNTIYPYRFNAVYVPYPGFPRFGTRDLETWNPEADIKILHLGDSFSYGFGVEIEDAWRVLLRQHLRGNGYNVTSLYSSFHSGEDSFATYHKTKSYSDMLDQINPNYIVHTIYLGNDIVTAAFHNEDWLPGSQAKKDRNVKRFRKNFKPFKSTGVNNFYWCLQNYLKRSYLYIWCQYLMGKGSMAKEETLKHINLINTFNLYYPDYDFIVNASGSDLMDPMATIIHQDKNPKLKKGLERVVEGAIGLNNLCKEKGIQLIVYIFPISHQVYWDDIVRQEPRYQKHDPLKQNRTIVEKLSAKGVIVKDITYDMIKSKEGDMCYYFPNDMHWTVSGNRKAFEIIKNHFMSVVKPSGTD